MRIKIPTFDKIEMPTVRVGNVKRRRFHVIDKVIQKTRQQIMEQEDADIFAAIEGYKRKYHICA